VILSESNFATSSNDKGGSHIDYSVAAFVEMPIKRSIKKRWWQGITAKKMIDNEFLFRTSIASDIITNILFVILIIFLYRLFREVNELLALFMAGLAFVAIPVSFIGESLRLIALEIFKGNLLRSFSTEQALEISTTLLKVDSYTGQLVTFHWGLWLIPMGWLVCRSGFIPKILAYCFL